MWVLLTPIWVVPLLAGDLLEETLVAHRAARASVSTIACRVHLDCKYVNGDGKFIHRQDDARWWYGPQFIRYRAKRFFNEPIPPEIREFRFPHGVRRVDRDGVRFTGG